MCKMKEGFVHAAVGGRKPWELTRCCPSPPIAQSAQVLLCPLGGRKGAHKWPVWAVATAAGITLKLSVSAYPTNMEHHRSKLLSSEMEEVDALVDTWTNQYMYLTLFTSVRSCHFDLERLGPSVSDILPHPRNCNMLPRIPCSVRTSATLCHAVGI